MPSTRHAGFFDREAIRSVRRIYAINNSHIEKSIYLNEKHVLHCGIMNKKTYYGCLAGILVAMIVALGFGMTLGNPALLVIIVISAVGAIWLCHSRVTDVMTDDLNSSISGKAALHALEVTIIVAAIGFAVGMGFYFNSGWGVGMHQFDDGSLKISYSEFYPHGNQLYRDSVIISNPAYPDIEEITALEKMTGDAHRVREMPFGFAAGMGFIVMLLVTMFAAFSYYYKGKYEG